MKVEAVSLADIQREAPEWLVEGRIPRKSITILAGEEGLGKGLYAAMLAARLSREGLTTLLLSAEDSPSMALRPRLEAAGAELGYISVVRLAGAGELQGGLHLPGDHREFKRLVQETGASLVVIDPVMAHIDAKTNTWNDQHVRLALAPAFEIAEKTGCAVLAIAHLNKSKSDDAAIRVGGSRAFRGSARSLLILARDPDDPEQERGKRRVLAHNKSNLSELAPSEVYEVRPVTVPADGPAPEVRTAKLVFLHESDHDGRDLLAALDGDEHQARSEAMDFIRGELAAGPRSSSEIKNAGKAHGLSESALNRAKRRLRVVSDKTGFEGGWVWTLPEQKKAQSNGHVPGALKVPADVAALLENTA